MFKFSPPEGTESILCPQCGRRAFQDSGCVVRIERIRTISGFSAQSSDGEPIGLVVHCVCGCNNMAPLVPRSQ